MTLVTAILQCALVLTQFLNVIIFSPNNPLSLTF